MSTCDTPTVGPRSVGRSCPKPFKTVMLLVYPGAEDLYVQAPCRANTVASFSRTVGAAEPDIWLTSRQDPSLIDFYSAQACHRLTVGANSVNATDTMNQIRVGTNFPAGIQALKICCTQSSLRVHYYSDDRCMSIDPELPGISADLGCSFDGGIAAWTWAQCQTSSTQSECPRIPSLTTIAGSMNSADHAVPEVDSEADSTTVIVAVVSLASLLGLLWLLWCVTIFLPSMYLIACC